MIAQVGFTLLLTVIILMAFVQLRQIPLVGAAVIGAALFGGYLVWTPEDATAIAHLIGVGRGTDLILYVWVLISLAILLVLYLQIREQLQIIPVLARTLALAEARADGAEDTRSGPKDFRLGDNSDRRET
jgi:small membrane protein